MCMMPRFLGEWSESDEGFERAVVASPTGMNILAGATLGGGTRVNWQASFKTPSHVRKEWAEQHGLPDITSEKFDRALDTVCTRLGVTTGVLLVIFSRSVIYHDSHMQGIFMDKRVWQWWADLNAA